MEISDARDARPFGLPPLPPGDRAPPPGGGSNGQKVKTKIHRLRFDEVWHPTRGGRPGNRNAVKHDGKEDLRRLRAVVRAFRARAKKARRESEDRAAARTCPEA